MLELSPRKDIPDEEYKQLFKMKIPEQHKLSALFLEYDWSKTDLKSHPLIKILGGHPLSIKVAAPLNQDKQPVEVSNTSTVTSLSSLNFSLEQLKQKNPQIVDFLLLMSFLETGEKGEALF